MNVANICSILWMIFGVVWVVGAFMTKRVQERAPLGSRLLYAVPIVLASYLMFSKNLPHWSEQRHLPSDARLGVLAVVVTAAGIGLAIWARLYLGQNWSGAVSVKREHELVRTGPYMWVRHPIYSGILLALIGTSLVRGKPIDLFAIALFWLGFWIKSRMEEQFMRKTFGEEYIAYSRTTGGLIPKFRLPGA